MRKVFLLLLILILCTSLFSCTKETMSKTFFEYFDTVSVVYSYAGDSEERFSEMYRGVEEILSKYHMLFDIYEDYEGINNLKTVNDNAGVAPVSVSVELIEFLLYAKEMHEVTGGEMNIAMGSVLRLWHECRENADKDPENVTVPSKESLEEASRYTSIDSIVIDEENRTVYISDPLCSIDVGAVGKGFATAKVSEWLEAMGADGYVLNFGGSIRVIGGKPGGGGFITGITNPDRDSDEPFVATVILKNIYCVTSGNYERYFTVGDVNYHHIIDKDTLLPADYFSSVTVLSNDGALADTLSTALFCMPLEEGMELAQKTGVDVIFVDTEYNVTMTEGVKKMTR